MSRQQNRPSVFITAPSYKNASKLKSKLKKYADDLANFTGVKSWNKKKWKIAEGTSRTLEIAIPPVEMSREQAEAFSEIIKYASEKGVEVITRIVR